jgi:hypothetical protein
MKYSIGDLFIDQNKVEDNRNNEKENIFYIVSIRTSTFQGIKHIWIETKNPQETHTRTVEMNSVEYFIDHGIWKHFPIR